MKRIYRIIAIINDVRNGIDHPEVELEKVHWTEMTPGKVYIDVSKINAATAFVLDSIDDTNIRFKNNKSNVFYSVTDGLVLFSKTSSPWYAVKIRRAK